MPYQPEEQSLPQIRAPEETVAELAHGSPASLQTSKPKIPPLGRRHSVDQPGYHTAAAAPLHAAGSAAEGRVALQPRPPAAPRSAPFPAPQSTAPQATEPAAPQAQPAAQAPRVSGAADVEALTSEPAPQQHATQSQALGHQRSASGSGAIPFRSVTPQAKAVVSQPQEQGSAAQPPPQTLQEHLQAEQQPNSPIIVRPADTDNQNLEPGVAPRSRTEAAPSLASSSGSSHRAADGGRSTAGGNGTGEPKLPADSPEHRVAQGPLSAQPFDSEPAASQSDVLTESDTQPLPGTAASTLADAALSGISAPLPTATPHPQPAAQPALDAAVSGTADASAPAPSQPAGLDPELPLLPPMAAPAPAAGLASIGSLNAAGDSTTHDGGGNSGSNAAAPSGDAQQAGGGREAQLAKTVAVLRSRLDARQVEIQQLEELLQQADDRASGARPSADWLLVPSVECWS